MGQNVAQVVFPLPEALSTALTNGYLMTSRDANISVLPDGLLPRWALAPLPPNEYRGRVRRHDLCTAGQVRRALKTLAEID